MEPTDLKPVIKPSPPDADTAGSDTWRSENPVAPLSLEAEPVSETVEAAPLRPASSLASSAPVPTVSQPLDDQNRGGFSLFRFNRQALLITAAVICIILLLGFGAWALLAGSKDRSGAGTADYAVGSNLSVSGVKTNPELQVGQADLLTINGRLQVRDTLVLAPTATPTAPTAGQIYYDKATNTPYYYNGTQFVSLAPQTGVTSLGGSTGAIGLGNGLTIIGGQLSVSDALLQQIAAAANRGGGVTSLQGQTGSVTLNSGPGISINGTTISNSGVVGLASGSANLVVTSDGNGNYTITDTGGGGGTIGGSGTPTHIAKFDTSNSIADSNLTEVGTQLTYAGNVVVNAAGGFSGNLLNLEVNGSSKFTVDQSGNTIQAGTLTVNGTGASSIAGSLSVGTGLTVTTGGANVTGNSVVNGTLTGLTGLTSAGTITFSGLNTAGIVHNNASGVLSTGPVQLGVDTSGNYVANLGTLTGLTTTGNSGSGSTPTLSVTYGSGPNTAVQGNTTLTCPSGTGNLQAGGNTITLGAGGSCNNITITDSPTFAGNLTVQGGGGITVGATGVDGVIKLLNSANANVTTVKGAAVGQNQTITIPDAGAASDEVCLVNLGNCAGSGGGITGSGTPTHLSKFNGTGSITDSGLTETGSTLNYGGNVVIQGSNSLSLGTSSSATGSIAFKNAANGNTLTLQSGATTGNLTLTLPTADGSANDCLKTNGSGVLTFTSCTGGPGGGVTSLNTLSGVLTLNNATTSGGNTITINDAKADAATKGIATFNATNFTDNGAGTINTIQDIAPGSTPTFAGLNLSAPLAVASGGTGANNFTLNGILYGNGTNPIQVTAAAPNSVLVTDGSNVPSLSQTLPTAVQSNITGTGALSSGSIVTGFGSISTGNMISTTASLHGGTLSAGSSNQFQVDGSGNAGTTGTLAVQGAGGITVGVAGTTPGVINLANGTNTNLSVLQAGAPTGTGNATYNLPGIAGGTSDDLCLKSLGNCAGSGGVIGGGGTVNHIAKFSPDGNHIADSGLTESGTTLTYAGNLVVNAGSGFSGNLINLEVNGSSKFSVDQAGNSIQAGTLTVNGTGASSIAGTLSIGTLGSGGNTSLCSNAGVISTCSSTGPGTQGFWTRSGTTLQPANAGDNVTTSGNISTTGTGGITSAGDFVANGTALFKNSADSSAAFQVQNAGGSNLIVADTANSKVGINTGAIALNTNLNVYNGQPSTTQTDLTQNLSRSGINFMTDYVQDAYTGGLFWSTQNNNPTSPKAGIYTQLTNSGSKLLFGTSSSYAAGLTNTALTLGSNGEAIFRNGFNTPAGFQIQNAVGTGLFTVDTTTGATLTTSLFVDTLGTGGTTALCWNGALQVSTCASTGSIGYWNRTGTTLQPATAGDNITTSGNISTTGTGGITSAGNFVANGTALFQNTSNSTAAFQIQTAGPSATTLLNVDTTNKRVSVGTIGTPTGQLYVSGQIPSSTTGSVTTGSISLDLYVQDHYAYVTGTSNLLQIFDVSNPASPTLVGSATTLGNQVQAIYVQGRYAYVLNNVASPTIEVFDVSNPASPVSVGSAATAAGPQDIYVQGRYAYVADSTGNALQIFDISNPVSPTLVGSLGINAGRVRVQDRYAYVMDYTNNVLRVIDVSNPASPVAVGSVSATGSVTDYNVQGRYVYAVTNTSNLLRIFDVSNPASPTLTGSVSAPSNPTSVSVQGRYAYVSAQAGGQPLYTFDVSNPASPTLVGSYSASNNLGHSVVQGRYLYGLSSGSLRIIDLGGAYVQQLEVGGVQTNTITAIGNASVGGNISIQGGLSVGDSSYLAGDLGVGGNAIFRNNTDSTTAFQIQNSAGSSLLTVDTTNHVVVLAANTALAIGNGYLYENGSGDLRIGSDSDTVVVRNDANDNQAFQVQDAGGTWLFNVNTSNATVNIQGTGANGGGGRLSFGDFDPVTTQTVFVGEQGSGDTDTLQLNGYGGVQITSGSLTSPEVVGNFGYDSGRDSGVLELGNTTSGGYLQFSNNSTFKWSIGMDSANACSGSTPSDTLYFYTGVVGGCALQFNSGGQTTFKSVSSNSAFQIQNSGGNPLFNVNSTSNAITLFSGVTGGTLTTDIAGTKTSNAVCHSGGSGANENVQIVACTGSIVADYAENYPVAAGVDYGDIVVTGSNMVNTYDTDAEGNADWGKVKGQVTQLVKSGAPYQTNTIGILSDNHGNFSSVGYNIKPEDNPMPVALNGRVPVNISSGSDAVQPGDYLTTSGDSGKAMKASQAGFVIGKALEAWNPASGKTQLMVFVEPGYWPGPTNAHYLQNGGSADFSNLNVSGNATINNLSVTTLNAAIASIGTLTVTGSAQFSGDIIVGGHVITAGQTPGTQVQAGAGTGATCTVSGNDTGGKVTITTGSNGLAEGQQCVLTFTKGFSQTPNPVIAPRNKASAQAQAFIDADAHTMSIEFANTPAANTTYTFNYFNTQ